MPSQQTIGTCAAEMNQSLLRTCSVLLLPLFLSSAWQAAEFCPTAHSPVCVPFTTVASYKPSCFFSFFHPWQNELRQYRTMSRQRWFTIQEMSAALEAERVRSNWLKPHECSQSEPKVVPKALSCCIDCAFLVWLDEHIVSSYWFFSVNISVSSWQKIRRKQRSAQAGSQVPPRLFDQCSNARYSGLLRLLLFFLCTYLEMSGPSSLAQPCVTLLDKYTMHFDYVPSYSGTTWVNDRSCTPRPPLADSSYPRVLRRKKRRKISDSVSFAAARAAFVTPDHRPGSFPRHKKSTRIPGGVFARRRWLSVDISAPSATLPQPQFPRLSHPHHPSDWNFGLWLKSQTLLFVWLPLPSLWLSDPLMVYRDQADRSADFTTWLADGCGNPPTLKGARRKSKHRSQCTWRNHACGGYYSWLGNVWYSHHGVVWQVQHWLYREAAHWGKSDDSSDCKCLYAMRTSSKPQVRLVTIRITASVLINRICDLRYSIVVSFD